MIRQMDSILLVFFFRSLEHGGEAVVFLLCTGAWGVCFRKNKWCFLSLAHGGKKITLHFWSLKWAGVWFTLHWCSVFRSPVVCLRAEITNAAEAQCLSVTPTWEQWSRYIQVRVWMSETCHWRLKNLQKDPAVLLMLSWIMLWVFWKQCVWQEKPIRLAVKYWLRCKP